MEKKIKMLFGARIVMWITAAIFTIYWIWYSFKLYADSDSVTGTIDEHIYASQLRPVFYTCVLISVACVLISFGLRRISDRIKQSSDYHKYSSEE